MIKQQLIKALKRFPVEAQTHIYAAVENPRTRERALAVLSRPDPQRAVAEQAREDMMELARPTGKTVVFRSLALPFAHRLRSAQSAIMRSLPTRKTVAGRKTWDIVRTSRDPESALRSHFMAEAVRGSEETGMGQFSSMMSFAGSAASGVARSAASAVSSTTSVLGSILNTVVGIGQTVLPILAPVLIAKLLPKPKEPAAPVAAPVAPAAAPQVIMVPAAPPTEVKAWYENPLVVVGGLAVLGTGVYLATRG